MTSYRIRYSDTRDLPLDGVLRLYKANNWAAADKPTQLHKALVNSHSLITAWHEADLIGLANAITDGHLVVYYPHLLVLPEFQRQGVGRRLMEILMARYPEFHQHILVAEADAVGFYKKIGFIRAGNTEPMEIYAGADH